MIIMIYIVYDDSGVMKLKNINMFTSIGHSINIKFSLIIV